MYVSNDMFSCNRFDSGRNKLPGICSQQQLPVEYQRNLLKLCCNCFRYSFTTTDKSTKVILTHQDVCRYIMT